MLLSNSYTAQSSLSQGRELDRVASKLDRAQGNVAAAERDLRNFLGALAETWARWVDGWQVFCDEAQDLEEERVDFLKDVCWAYANSVSSVCVVDDEVRARRFRLILFISTTRLTLSVFSFPEQACERMRVALETVDAFAESAGFVRAHATSSQIPDPPRFVNYSAGEREPDAVAFREARFVRRSQRPAPVGVSEGVGPAAVDEQARRAEEDLAPRRSEEEVGEVQRAMEGMGLVQAPQTNGRAPAFAAAAAAPAPAPPAPVAAPQQQYEIPPPPAPAPAPVPVALLQQQQRQQQAPPPQLPQSIMSPPPHPSQIPPPPSSWTQPSHAAPPAPTASPAAAPATAAAAAAPVEDPIAKALADLQAKRMSRQGSFRSTASRASRHSQAIPASPRESVLSPAMYQSSGGQFAGGQQQASPSLVPPQGGSTAASLAHSQADFDARSNGGHGASSSVASRNDPRRRSVDYSQAGESIVGQHPSSRPNSPAPSSARAPSPAFMQAPVQPPSALPVEQVLDNYHQSFPGEQRENRARRNSAASDAASAYRQSMAVPSSASQAGHGDRSPSREGFAGVGTSMARAASPSPSFGGQQQQQQPNRAPSPSPSFIPQQQGYPGRAPSPSPSFGQQGGFQQSLHQPPARGASPAPSQMSRRSVGIALGSNGAVDRDEMADAYRSPSAPPPAPAPAPAPPAAPQQQQPAPVMSPQTLYSPYAGQPPAGVAGQQPGPPHQAAYGGYPAYGYAPPPPQTQAYPGYGQQYGGYAPPPAAAAGAPPMQAQGSQQGHAGRSGSVVSHQSAHSYQQQQQQQPPQQPQQQQQQAPQQMQPPPQAQQQGPPSPQTPGAYDQHTDAGQPVIFYGPSAHACSTAALAMPH